MVSVQANTVKNRSKTPASPVKPASTTKAKTQAVTQASPALAPADKASLVRQGKALNSIGLTEATLDQVREGLVLEPGSSGPAVKAMQQLLSKAGYPVATSSSFGPTTEAVLRRFQGDTGLQVTGKLGPTTLKLLENPLRATAFGKRLAGFGRSLAQSLGGYSSLGKCYTGVGLALVKAGVNVTGLSAWMAADQLAKSARFREVKLPAAQLPKLPAGAVVVWDRSNDPAKRNWGHGWTHGHISIADGKGREMSDYIDSQRTSYYASKRFRVFLPK